MTHSEKIRILRDFWATHKDHPTVAAKYCPFLYEIKVLCCSCDDLCHSFPILTREKPVHEKPDCPCFEFGAKDAMLRLNKLLVKEQAIE